MSRTNNTGKNLLPDAYGLLPYLMPAEWEPHERVWLAWPHLRSDWPGKFAAIPFVFAEIIRGITRNGRAGLVVRDAAMKQQASDLLDASGIDLTRIDWLEHPTNRGWLRDCGAIFVRSGNQKTGARSQNKGRAPSAPSPLGGGPGRGSNLLAALDFRFNGWAKYPNHKKDDALAAKIATYAKSPLITPVLSSAAGSENGSKQGRQGSVHKVHDRGRTQHSAICSPADGERVVLEGGAIDVDGLGTLLTTEECLLSDIQCRNPGFTRADYEAVFAKYLGITHTIWLNKGIEGDDTHGHVDDLTRFVAPGRVVTVIEKNKSSHNHALLKENFARLKKARDARGKALDLIELPMPDPVTFEGQVLPASYANFLITNGVVLVPVFNDPHDRLALNLLAEALPKHQILPIYARDLVLGLGTIHCLTQQQPFP